MTREQRQRETIAKLRAKLRALEAENRRLRRPANRKLKDEKRHSRHLVNAYENELEQTRTKLGPKLKPPVIISADYKDMTDEQREWKQKEKQVYLAGRGRS